MAWCVVVVRRRRLWRSPQAACNPRHGPTAGRDLGSSALSAPGIPRRRSPRRRSASLSKWTRGLGTITHRDRLRWAIHHQDARWCLAHLNLSPCVVAVVGTQVAALTRSSAEARPLAPRHPPRQRSFKQRSPGWHRDERAAELLGQGAPRNMCKDDSNTVPPTHTHNHNDDNISPNAIAPNKDCLGVGYNSLHEASDA